MDIVEKLRDWGQDIPAWSEPLRAEIERRIPDGAWIQSAGDWAKLMRNTHLLEPRAVLMKDGKPVPYVTAKTREEMADERMSADLRGLVDWAKTGKR
jgi:hypothetical protein